MEGFLDRDCVKAASGGFCLNLQLYCAIRDKKNKNMKVAKVAS
jgi:hypothetical protein